MAIFYQPDLPRGATFLTEEESRHSVKVLRQRPGDNITVVDGAGSYYQATIENANPKKCTFLVLSQHQQPQTNYSSTLLIAPTKSLDRTEWMVEKLTEIGIDTIQFVACRHSERRVLKLDRLERKAISAMKQSGRALLPQLRPIIPLTSWQTNSTSGSQKFIGYLGKEASPELIRTAKPANDYVILIGPEGGFAPDEVIWAQQQQFKIVSLGNYRLRTETAGLVAVQTLHSLNQL
jgi:16S rRNA (uracil1498-N3)-methyltransferase